MYMQPGRTGHSVRTSKHLPPAARRQRVRGLGDLVGIVLSKVGIRPKRGCGCEKRKTILNKYFPNLWKKG